MNFNNLQGVRILHKARKKVIKDFFSEFEKVDDEFLEPDLNIHAAGLCIYAAILTTKIHEISAEDIKLESNKRENDYISYLQNSQKYSHLTKQEIQSKAHKFLMNDIRNSFAHGDFKISYEDETLFFILSSQRFNISTPIVISSTSLKDLILRPILNIGLQLKLVDENEVENIIHNNLTIFLKEMIFPAQMLQCFDYYIKKGTAKPDIDDSKYLMIKYVLLVTQLTYEQDDFYHIFGADSNLFKKLALIRNSIAHDSYFFLHITRHISYVDKDKTIDENLYESVAALEIMDSIKEAIKSATSKGFEPEIIELMKESLIKKFENYFSNIKNNNSNTIKHLK